ncbi:sugar phosphate isomerase/epimerase family protein [Rhizobium sp. TRM95796]|uniref:sugar phosphate isomerase/epimerase family protein n=1 Tax=Rhizobium sp. TRM95796 TaxID=2979862 RepID=UPI0021E82E0D|nr:sugar phosphate isomerase/epimerase [Rhizobium sp. TRM95796]MCV3769051.1 sugar phosphate isomerase/epimerase [Rhizobium sp. TRM95796]
MRIGIFAKTFAGERPGPVLAAAKAAGYDCVQFNFACCGLPPMPDSLDEAVLEDISVARETSGVEISALSATYNMIHPDKALRAEGLVRLGVAIRAAADLGIPLVTLCTGTRDADDQWRHHPDNQTEEAWRDLIKEMGRAATLGEAHGVCLGIEPERANVIRDAHDAARLFAAVPSDRLKIVLDPANLFEMASVEEARAIVAAAIDALGPRIAMAHAKDRDADGDFVTAGRGVVDFPDMFRRLKAAGFDGPVVTHGLSAAEAPEVSDFLRRLAV